MERTSLRMTTALVRPAVTARSRVSETQAASEDHVIERAKASRAPPMRMASTSRPW